MYTPGYFKMNDPDEIRNFINENSFAILISNNEGKINATHIPVLFESGEGSKGFLYGHFAKANQQWKNIDKEVLVIFPGAHKYISPTWYESNQTVPTWSYISVHIYGNIEIVNSKEKKIKLVKDLVKYFESDESSYSTDQLKQSYFDGLINGIVGFKIEITRIEGKKKISQNHPEERQKRVIDKLKEIGDDDSQKIVEKMKENLEKLQSNDQNNITDMNGN
ncbi:MAG TPA: FMN-binding negative transcriptional regulator [Ignavibacteria bacterium]|nr:FMN-binding negative transcriptional regulator [Ignavibacteria bacterium]